MYSEVKPCAIQWVLTPCLSVCVLDCILRNILSKTPQNIWQGGWEGEGLFCGGGEGNGSWQVIPSSPPPPAAIGGWEGIRDPLTLLQLMILAAKAKDLVSFASNFLNQPPPPHVCAFIVQLG